MELKWLEDFLALVKFGSFSEAANQRCVTQPGFSRRIRALEEWLGVPLFDRNTTPISLTEPGENFLPQARKLAAEMRAVQHDLKLMHDKKASSIRIMTSHRLSISTAPLIVTDFIETHPSTQVIVLPHIQHIAEYSDYTDALLNGIADFLLTYENDAFPFQDNLSSQIERAYVQPEKIIPVAAPSFAAKLGDEWWRNENLEIQYLGYPSYSFTEQTIEPVLKNLKPRLNKVYETSFTGSIRQILIRGIGLSWLPATVVEEDLQAGRLIHVGTDDLAATVHTVLYRRKTPQPPLVEAFWEHAARFHANNG